MAVKFRDMTPEQKAKRLAACKKWREANKQRVWEYNQDVAAKRKIGLYPQSKRSERKAKRLERLAGRPRPKHCEVCGRGGKIVWDHCHTSGLFRGWLCEGCNCTLGFARDNPGTLRLLAEYLDGAS